MGVRLEVEEMLLLEGEKRRPTLWEWRRGLGVGG